MRERVTLTLKEQARVKVLTMVIEGRCESAEAAQLLQMSVRHLLRLKRAFREEGPAAVAHGNRGRRPGHAIQEELRREILELASTAYAGYNHTHLTEALEESHGISLSRRSVSRILTAAGLRRPRSGGDGHHPHPRSLTAGQGPRGALLGNAAGPSREGVAQGGRTNPGGR